MFDMSNIERFAILMVSALLTSACMAIDQHPMLFASVATPQRDALYQADRVRAAPLAYTPDGTSFAPVLTERFAYPSHAQAQFAFERSRWSVPDVAMSLGAQHGHDMAAIAETRSVRIFACQPGGFDGPTGRIARYRGPVVICVTEFLDGRGQVHHRQPVNFYYHHGVWQMQVPESRLSPVS